MRPEKKEGDYLLQEDIIAKLDNKQTIKGRSSPLERLIFPIAHLSLPWSIG